MRFRPRTPDDQINVSVEHPLKELAWLLAAVGTLVFVVVLALVFIVELVILFVPPDTEVRLMRSFQPASVVDTTPDQRIAFVQQLTNRLLQRWPESPYQLTVSVAADDAVNAYALPGGHVIVTNGLLDAVRSENELAFVLGHEIGHFANRDHLRGLGLMFAVSLLLAPVTGSSGSELLTSMSDVAARSFARDHELDADLFGLQLVAAEYGHVNGATHFFERLLRSDAGYGRWASYISTHPAGEQRVARLQAQDQWAQTGALTPLPWREAP